MDGLLAFTYESATGTKVKVPPGTIVVEVGVRVGVYVAVGVRVVVEVEVTVGVFVGVCVGVRVKVAVAVGVLVKVAVLVGVFVTPDAPVVNVKVELFTAEVPSLATAYHS